MKLLIVGGTGVLSSAVVSEALSKGFEVTMINRGNRPERIPSSVKLIRADIRNNDNLYFQLSGRHFDAVIDFICYNKEQIAHSLELFSGIVDQYVFISSACVYDTTFPGIKVEDSPKGLKLWDYSTDKWDAEQFLVSKAAEYRVNHTIIRPCVTYDDTRIPYGIAPRYGFHWTLCARILAGKPIITWNGGLNRCNMMRVEDFAIGIVGLIGNPQAFDEAFNICGDEAPSWNDVLKAMGEILGKDVATVDITPEFYADSIPSRSGEILGGRALDAFNSNAKIKEIVPEFRQSISLKDGIAKTISAYRTHNYQSGIDWRFDAETDMIVKKWCTENNLPTKQFRLRFIDYLGNASLKDRLTYYYTKHKDNFFVRILQRIRIF